MKNRKINWLNVILLILLCVCLFITIHDLLTITIFSWIREEIASFSVLGLITFLFVVLIESCIIYYFTDEIKKKTYKL